jgi:hypothetical protein
MILPGGVPGKDHLGGRWLDLLGGTLGFPQGFQRPLGGLLVGIMARDEALQLGGRAHRQRPHAGVPAMLDVYGALEPRLGVAPLLQAQPGAGENLGDGEPVNLLAIAAPCGMRVPTQGEGGDPPGVARARQSGVLLAVTEQDAEQPTRRGTIMVLSRVLGAAVLVLTGGFRHGTSSILG